MFRCAHFFLQQFDLFNLHLKYHHDYYILLEVGFFLLIFLYSLNSNLKREKNVKNIFGIFYILYIFKR